MSAFYVGQRVRLRYVRSLAWTFLEGTEGTVVAVGNFAPEACWAKGGDARVRMDQAPERLGQFVRDQLEPIIPPGLESIEEINALYEPSLAEQRA